MRQPEINASLINYHDLGLFISSDPLSQKLKAVDQLTCCTNFGLVELVHAFAYYTLRVRRPLIKTN
jgi:hypothetical protein